MLRKKVPEEYPECQISSNLSGLGERGVSFTRLHISLMFQYFTWHVLHSKLGGGNWIIQNLILCAGRGCWGEEQNSPRMLGLYDLIHFWVWKAFVHSRWWWCTVTLLILLEAWKPPLLQHGTSSSLWARSCCCPLLGCYWRELSLQVSPTGLIFLNRGRVRLGADVPLVLLIRRATSGPRWFNASDNNSQLMPLIILSLCQALARNLWQYFFVIPSLNTYLLNTNNVLGAGDTVVNKQGENI